MTEQIQRKPRLLFVGAFSIGDDGMTGGTYVACKQLMDSRLTEVFDVVTIDISQVGVHSRKLSRRALAGLGRVLRVSALIISHRIDCALLFATLGPSWFERGLMSIICQAGGVRSYIFSRCAEVNKEIEEKPGVRAFTRLMLSCGTQFIFQGRILRQRFLAIFPAAAESVYVIPNWIDLRWRQAIAPLAFEEPVHVLYMGWLHPMKGVDVLIEGLARHSQQFSNCRFVLCGDGSERTSLEAAAAKTGLDVQFRGWVHNEAKIAAYSDAQIVVLPSRVEGMPNVLLEAMSVARPVVATAVGSVCDLVDDGVEGLVVPPENPDALAMAVLALVRDPGLGIRLGIAGKAKIERDHNINIACQKLVDLLLPTSKAQQTQTTLK